MTIVKMKTLLIFICLIIGILNVCASETNKPTKLTTTKQIADDTTTNIEATAAAASAPVASTIALTNDATKDKRETKDTKDAASVGYANHRSDKITSVHRNSNANSDDPEDPQETVYGTNARQFLIRPQQQQQQQQNEEEQLPPQLRNYPATIRPHNTQLLEQSQEIQHFAYLQDLNRNQHKIQNSGKSQSPQIKKSASASLRSQAPTTQVEETEQRYAVAVEQPIPLHPRHPQYRQQVPYQLALQQQQQQQLAQQQQAEQQQNPNQAQYQIIPEEQFLKILEEELQARAYQEDQVRRHQAVQANAQRAQQQAQQQQQQHQSAAAAAAASQKVALQAQGLGQYRQRLEAEEDSQPEYIQYVQRPRGGPKYLPLPQGGPREQPGEQELAASPQPLPQLPPQIAYYQPQISYKALPNHPLAKSSLEKEIEMLLASNKPNVAPVQIIDNSNEPSAVVNNHQRAPAPPPPAPQPSVRTPKAYVPSTVAPNLIDTNDQPFVPSLFRFSNYPQPTQNYPAPVSQQVIDAKKLGPVVYPPQNPQPTPSAPTPAQAAQFYYQEPAPSPQPSPRPKAYRSKYGTKFATTPTPLKSRQNEINYAAHNKFTQPLYDLQRPVPSAAPGAPTHFYPSPPDPHRSIPPTPQPTPAVTTKFNGAPSDFRQFASPGASPSQSSIYVSQGTGIATPSRPISTAKPKTVDDLKQLHLPQPGGKPLTQAEFQALVDAGYPVTAVPVPVPVPYEQYVKDHPDYRNQPPPQPPALPVNYEHLMRFAQLQQHHQVPQYGPQRPQHPRGLLGRPSEPSVKIISSASEPQTATALGGGSVTYLRAIPENQKRRPRDESETKVLGAKEEEDVKTIDETKQEVEKTK